MKLIGKNKTAIVLLSVLALAVVGYFVYAALAAPKYAPMVSEKVEQSLAFGEVRFLESAANFPSGISFPAGTRYIVEPSRLRHGGPQKDGIPSIDDPKFTSAAEADEWLQPDDLVQAIVHLGVAKAYPHKILNWHEIVNDDTGPEPLLVTYCPLCRSGIIFSPIIDSERVEFGTSGMLWNSDLIMYDRKTQSLWSQIWGQAIIGPLTPLTLKQIPYETTTWGAWKAAHPDTLVLSRDTGYTRPYDIADIYGVYRPGFAGFGVDFTDTRLESNAIVYGVGEPQGNESKAYHEAAIARDGVINDEVAGIPIVLIWDYDLSAARVFKRTFQNETLTFETRDRKVFDDMGREWTYEGALRPQFGSGELERISSFPHFWFAWLAFYPETELYK